MRAPSGSEQTGRYRYIIGIVSAHKPPPPCISPPSPSTLDQLYILPVLPPSATTSTHARPSSQPPHQLHSHCPHLMHAAVRSARAAFRAGRLTAPEYQRALAAHIGMAVGV